MSVKTASRLVARAMRVAIGETVTPANQKEDLTSQGHTFSEAGRVSRQFGTRLHQRLNAYTGSVDEFGCPGNTVDSWRFEFSHRETAPKAANGSAVRKQKLHG